VLLEEYIFFSCGQFSEYGIQTPQAETSTLHIATYSPFQCNQQVSIQKFLNPVLSFATTTLQLPKKKKSN
jgi:hypothetical protein